MGGMSSRPEFTKNHKEMINKILHQARQIPKIPQRRILFLPQMITESGGWLLVAGKDNLHLHNEISTTFNLSFYNLVQAHFVESRELWLQTPWNIIDAIKILTPEDRFNYLEKIGYDVIRDSLSGCIRSQFENMFCDCLHIIVNALPGNQRLSFFEGIGYDYICNMYQQYYPVNRDIDSYHDIFRFIGSLRNQYVFPFVHAVLDKMGTSKVMFDRIIFRLNEHDRDREWKNPLPNEEIWKVVERFYGADHSQKMLSVFNNNPESLIDVFNFISFAKTVSGGFMAHDGECFNRMFKDKTREQQYLMIDLLGGPDEIRKLLCGCIRWTATYNVDDRLSEEVKVLFDDYTKNKNLYEKTDVKAFLHFGTFGTHQSEIHVAPSLTVAKSAESTVRAKY